MVSSEFLHRRLESRLGCKDFKAHHSRPHFRVRSPSTKNIPFAGLGLREFRISGFGAISGPSGDSGASVAACVGDAGWSLRSTEKFLKDLGTQRNFR